MEVRGVPDVAGESDGGASCVPLRAEAAPHGPAADATAVHRQQQPACTQSHTPL